MVEEICLSGKLDLNAAAALHSQLLAAVAAEKDVCLDIGDVTLFGALAAQTCLAAARGAKQKGNSFEIKGASEEVTQQLSFLGLTPQTLSEGLT